MSPADEAGIALLRSRGAGSPEIARRFGITRREVDEVMRKRSRKKMSKEVSACSR